MYHILYHGPDKAEYGRIRAELPGHYNLRICYDRTRLKTELSSSRPHGVILPLRNPAPEDLGYLKKIVSVPTIPGVVITAGEISVQQAVCCMRLGAYDCLSNRADGRIIAMVFDRMLSEQGQSLSISRNRLIIGSSKALEDMMHCIHRYADLDYPVLITGETGSGKELAARSIHEMSNRKDSPFNAVNCASFSDDLLGSELYGSRPGAFTGSVNRPGFFESSSGGTLFLDEIGELSLQGQASLLRVLEEKCIRRMGSMQTIRVDVRVLAATNRPLRQLMKERLFRPDLFYRLNLLGLTVPPLRKRTEDIPLIARNYLATLAKQWTLDNGAVAALVHYSWPGNVRELHSVLLKATLSATNGIIRHADIILS